MVNREHKNKLIKQYNLFYFATILFSTMFVFFIIDIVAKLIINDTEFMWYDYSIVGIIVSICFGLFSFITMSITMNNIIEYKKHLINRRLQLNLYRFSNAILFDDIDLATNTYNLISSNHNMSLICSSILLGIKINKLSFQDKVELLQDIGLLS